MPTTFRKAHVDAINSNGLRISGAADFTATLQATTDPKQIPPCDYGIIATKSTHTRPAIAQMAHVFANMARSARCKTASAMKKSSPST